MRKIAFYKSSIFILPLLLVSIPVTFANAVEDFSGYWNITWYSNQITASGTDFDHLTQTDSSVSGTMTCTSGCGSCGPNNTPLTGNVTGNVLSFTASHTCNGSYWVFKHQWVLTNNITNGTYTVYNDESLHSAGVITGKRAINYINATAGAGGTIIPAGKISVNAGGEKTFKIVPDSGYKILDVIVDGVSAGATASYTFSKVSANHTIIATFETAPITGSIVPSIVAPLLLDER